MHSLRLLRRVATWAAIVLAAGFLPSLSPASGASYTVPAVSTLEATLPASILGPETHLLCLMLSDVQGSQVQTRSVCYQSYKPDPPLEPPISDFWPAFHQLVTGAFIQETGVLLLPVMNCTEFFPGFAVSVAVAIQLDKGGGVATGSNVLTVDTSGPLFDCADGALPPGPLTLTPLDDSHDEDGDGCAYRDCLHRGESGCAVAARAQDDPFLRGRLASYGAMLAELR